MREANRLYKIYADIMTVHITHFPDWRFGQLMSNFCEWLSAVKDRDFFYVEDDEILEYLKAYAEENSVHERERA